MKRLAVFLFFSTLSLSVQALNVQAQGKKLYIYNWNDFIGEDTVSLFEKETGIDVIYESFDSNELLESKLLAGNTGYDLVVPSGAFVQRQIQAGLFQELDKSQIPNWRNLDQEQLKSYDTIDPENRYATPYLWQTTGVGYNVKEVQKYLGEDFVPKGWDLIFNPELMSELQGCKVSILNAPGEVIMSALIYLGLDPHTEKQEDFDKAKELLLSVRPYVTYFHSSQYLNDLASGSICVAMAWTGDVLQASEEASEGVEIRYLIPEEGALLSTDFMVIPTSAKNVDEAHQFLNFILRPEIMASITNYTWYPNLVPSSDAFLDKEVKENPGIYPSGEKMKSLVVERGIDYDADLRRSDSFIQVKRNK